MPSQDKSTGSTGGVVALRVCELPVILNCLRWWVESLRMTRERKSNMKISDNLEIPEEQFQWSFARSSGPGGQNVNKVNSKATLRWVGGKTTLSRSVWARFAEKAKRYLTTSGDVVIQSQEHRDQAQNIEACRAKLRELVRSALRPPKRRLPTKPTGASKRRRLEQKRRQADKKKSRAMKNF